MGILRNIRNRLIGENWGPASVRIPAKLRRAGGEGVRVLVIDSGVPDHGAVVGAIDVKNCRNFVWDEGKGDLNGHATSVCGVLLAWAPKVSITCFKAMDRDGHTDGCMAVLAARPRPRRPAPQPPGRDRHRAGHTARTVGGIAEYGKAPQGGT